jgi:hypothetical protein
MSPKLELRPEDEHPSEHALVRHRAGEGQPAERRRIEAHLADCPSCRRSLEQLADFERAFAEQHQRQGFLAAVQLAAEQAGPGRRRWLQPLAWSAAAAALLLVLGLVIWPGAGRRQPEPTERIKGAGLELDYLVAAGRRVVAAGPERVLHPGDRIQFRLSAPRGGYLHLVGVDAAGRVSVYYPRPGEPHPVYPGGAARPVPGSVILDETLGAERVFALICDRPLGRAELARRVRSAAADPRRWIAEQRLPLDCRQTSIMLHKEARP